MVVNITKRELETLESLYKRTLRLYERMKKRTGHKYLDPDDNLILAGISGAIAQLSRARDEAC